MKLVVLGCTGRIGNSLVIRALEREHEVLAIAKEPENIKTEHKNLQVCLEINHNQLACQRSLWGLR